MLFRGLSNDAFSWDSGLDEIRLFYTPSRGLFLSIVELLTTSKSIVERVNSLNNSCRDDRFLGSVSRDGSLRVELSHDIITMIKKK